MSNFVSFLLVLICFLMQSTLFSQFTIGGIMPNIVLMTIAIVGFLVGRKTSLILGFLVGLCMDVLYGSFLGFYALVYMYIGFANGVAKKLLFPNDFKLPLSLIALSDFAYGNICYIFLFLLRGQYNYLFYLRAVILPEVIFTSLIGIIVYPALYSIYKFIEDKEKQLAGEEELA